MSRLMRNTTTACNLAQLEHSHYDPQATNKMATIFIVSCLVNNYIVPTGPNSQCPPRFVNVCMPSLVTPTPRLASSSRTPMVRTLMLSTQQSHHMTMISALAPMTIVLLPNLMTVMPVTTPHTHHLMHWPTVMTVTPPHQTTLLLIPPLILQEWSEALQEWMLRLPMIILRLPTFMILPKVTMLLTHLLTTTPSTIQE